MRCRDNGKWGDTERERGRETERGSDEEGRGGASGMKKQHLERQINQTISLQTQPLELWFGQDEIAEG